MVYRNLSSKSKGQLSKLKILAPAKINIGLIVKEKLKSGYHRIETIMVPIKLFDTLFIKRTDNNGLNFSTDNIPNLPQDSTNLVVRATELFFDKINVEPKVKIILRKRIPIGAGLGGGSSDAAAVLLGLNQLFRKPLNIKTLHQIACQIGMDVPFFLYRTPCYVTGCGEILRPVKIPQLNVLLYTPDYFISTNWAYQQIDAMGLTETDFSLKILCKKLSQGNWQEISKYTVNTFEKVVFPKYNDLLIMKTQLLFFGAKVVSLSGSGSTIYGLAEKDDINNIRIKAKKHNLKLVFTQTLGNKNWGVV